MSCASGLTVVKLNIATGTKVGSNWKKKKEEFKVKLEEDISPPFRSRYSYSGTYTTDGQLVLPDLRDATKIFKPLRHFDEWSQLEPVGGSVLEFAYKGGELNLGRESGEVAVVVWKHVDEVVVAEVSFRYKDAKGKFLYSTARKAKKIYDDLQGFGWCNPVGITKTQYIYDEPSWLMGVMEFVA
tara:strand:- start:1145 stop:1696 length:552 start_codon:yes stop_codon:yes gene_type:complete